MSIIFPFRKDTSPIFGIIHRPVAEVYFKHKKQNLWQSVTMVVDSGADYTLLPHFLALELGINLNKDCKKINTQGVGGKSEVYLLKSKTKVRLGEYERNISVGFLSSDFIPPLMGRQDFFETFRVIFENLQVIFE